jgi:PAS domain S-box-containing protein
MYRSRLDGSGFLVVNQRYADLFGFTKEELLGSPSTLCWADRGARDKMVRLLGERGELRDYEIDIVTKSGEIRSILASIKLYPDEGYLEGSVVDITDRKRAEEALRESELKFREIVRHLDEGYYTCDMQAMLLDHNPAFNRIFGLDPEKNLKGSRMPRFWQNPDDREKYLAELMTTGFVKNLAADVKTPYGDKLVVMVNSRLVRDEAGRPVRIEGTFSDFTERTRAEKALRASEQRLRRFYESGLLGVIYWNTRGQITEANDKFLEMVGYTRAELDAGQIDWLSMTPPEYRQLDEESIAELRANGVNRVPIEKEYIRKDGTRISIAVAGAMLDDERVNGVAFVQDITERKRARKPLTGSITNSQP